MSTNDPRYDRPHDSVPPEELGYGGRGDEHAAEHRAEDDTRVEERPVAAGRPSERPTTDPRGPGTTFFTNHPDDVVAREKDAYGGVKVGSAFFGWLVAVGLLALLLGLLSGAGAVFGLASPDVVEDAVQSDPQTIGIAAGVVLLVVLLLAYFAGGYVAGRMARFDGAKQGVAVWLWAVVVAVVVAVLGLLAGDRFDVLAQVNAFPRLPVNEGDLTTGGIVAAVVAALVALLGAVLGGAAGTRYHRKVDRAGLLEEPVARERG
ncbi:hypothetical protein [Aquipuribacter sp. SD81]|uniref:hypothetical protein n=1 Tax=Aquipuribacter sp. SD81 TaxID=3127703 RepID=UPI003019B2AD